MWVWMQVALGVVGRVVVWGMSRVSVVALCPGGRGDRTKSLIVRRSPIASPWVTMRESSAEGGNQSQIEQNGCGAIKAVGRNGR